MAIPEREPERKLGGSGGRFLLIGAPIVIVGILLWILWRPGIGAAVTVLGCIPLAVGVALIASAAVSRRSRTGKPFA
jgi:hypothetical protein